MKIPSGRQAHSNEVVNTSSAVNTANDVDTTRTVSSASDNVPGIGDQGELCFLGIIFLGNLKKYLSYVFIFFIYVP